MLTSTEVKKVEGSLELHEAETQTRSKTWAWKAAGPRAWQLMAQEALNEQDGL